MKEALANLTYLLCSSGSARRSRHGASRLWEGSFPLAAVGSAGREHFRQIRSEPSVLKWTRRLAG
jgi:hypothetical protein